MGKPLPEEFVKLQEAKQKELELAAAREKEKKEYQLSLIDRLYNRIYNAFAPYDDVEINDHIVNIIKSDETKQVKFLIDGNIWLVFTVKLDFWFCSCDGPCDCGTSTSVAVDISQLRKDGIYKPYFSIYNDQYVDKVAVANFVNRVLEEYEITKNSIFV